MQLALVGQLEPDLTDVIRTLVVGCFVPFVDAFDVPIVDPADVTDDVRCDLAEGILAKQSRLDLDARKAITVDGEAGHFLVGKARAQGEAFEVFRLLQEAAESLAIALLDVDELPELVDRLVEVLYPGGRYFERVRGVALGEDDAVAVRNDAAVGNDWHDGDAIAFGERLIMLMLEQLQIDEAADEPRKPQRDKRGHDDQAAAEMRKLALGILELGGLERREPPAALDE